MQLDKLPADIILNILDYLDDVNDIYQLAQANRFFKYYLEPMVNILNYCDYRVQDKEEAFKGYLKYLPTFINSGFKTQCAIVFLHSKFNLEYLRNLEPTRELLVDVVDAECFNLLDNVTVPFRIIYYDHHNVKVLRIVLERYYDKIKRMYIPPEFESSIWPLYLNAIENGKLSHLEVCLSSDLDLPAFIESLKKSSIPSISVESYLDGETLDMIVDGIANSNVQYFSYGWDYKSSSDMIPLFEKLHTTNLAYLDVTFLAEDKQAFQIFIANIAESKLQKLQIYVAKEFLKELLDSIVCTKLEKLQFGCVYYKEGEWDSEYECYNDPKEITYFDDSCVDLLSLYINKLPMKALTLHLDNSCKIPGFIRSMENSPLKTLKINYGGAVAECNLVSFATALKNTSISYLCMGVDRIESLEIAREFGTLLKESSVRKLRLYLQVIAANVLVELVEPLRYSKLYYLEIRMKDKSNLSVLQKALSTCFPFQIRVFYSP
ncbi:hypothetical protein HK103_007435 [Boothiomyces macroporosus]|uniref:F-box domain-containing protein n=1 Tax=Boothiomyces macroporosus TaxID=261099 RepID=A0AAD5Y651_9FUNG|nr:hypothetical protein HK103_007435 [Boothiomyces macroporosus]